MVVTVRYLLGAYLVLISCSALHAASIPSRETNAPKTEIPTTNVNDEIQEATTFSSLKIAAITEIDAKNQSGNAILLDAVGSTSISNEDKISATKSEDKTTENYGNTVLPDLKQGTTIVPKKNITVSRSTVRPNRGDTTYANSRETLTAVELSTAETVETTTSKIPNKEINSTPSYLSRSTSSPNDNSSTPNVSQESANTTRNEIINEETKPRTENARALAFDISKFTSPEFHSRNNVYNLPTSPENEKFVNPDYDKSTTYKSTQSTTPGEYFDQHYQQIEHNLDNFEQHYTPTLEDLISKTNENKSDVNLDFLRYTNSVSDNKKDKNSFHISDESEKIVKVNFDSAYNDTKVIDEAVKIIRRPITKLLPVEDTTRIYPTKPSSKERISLRNNKIEIETTKSKELESPISVKQSPISVIKRGSTKFYDAGITDRVRTTQRNIAFKNNNDRSKEQTVQENNVVPVIVPGPTTTSPDSTTYVLYEMTHVDDDGEDEHDSSTILESTNASTKETYYEMTDVTSPLSALVDTTEEATTTETTTKLLSTEEAVTTTSPTTNKIFIRELTTVPSTTEKSTTTNEAETSTLDEVSTVPTTQSILEIGTTEMPNTSESSTTEEFTTFATIGQLKAVTGRKMNYDDDKYAIYESNEELTTQDTKDSETISTVTSTTINDENISTETETTTYEVTTNSIATTNRFEETSTIASVENSTTEQPIATTGIPDTTTMNITNATSKIGVTSTETSITSTDIDDDSIEDYVDFHNRGKPTQSNHEEIEIVHIEPSDHEHTTVKSVTNAIDVAHSSPNSSITPGTTEEATTEGTTETITAGQGLGDPDDGNSGTVIAIVISSVGAICLVLLAGLLFVMRRRQKRFNYGQRCTPVSLDAYSMDNVSVYNSVRRKTALRGSKRSYGNPAFDDTQVSHPLNFQNLVRFVGYPEEIQAEFDDIPQVTARMTELPEGCDTKNRYANVIPLPETRVFLSPVQDDPIGDYINANYVTGPKGVRNYYIACQAPLQTTVNDFWRMIWEQQSKVVIMLTHLFENGVEKCVDYLPPSEVLDCHRMFGDYQVTLKNREVKDKYIISSLQLKNMVTNSWREVTHFWYSGWPEKGVPSEENSLIACLIEARSYVKLVQNNADVRAKEASNGNFINGTADVSPVVVHCSPGTGRTGTVIACDIAIREFELKRVVDIPKIVYRIRRDRASSVQTKDQYNFIYKVINLYATKLTGGALDSI